MTSYKMLKMNGTPIVEIDRRAICRRCGVVMSDIEPHTTHGEFWHPLKRVCSNRGKYLSLDPKHQKEVAPFERKRVRRAAVRAGTRV